MCKNKKDEKNNKMHISKVPKTTEENFEHHAQKQKENENKEMAEELEDLFEDEYEYDDD